MEVFLVNSSSPNLFADRSRGKAMSFAAGNPSFPRFSFRRTSESSPKCCLKPPFPSRSLSITPSRRNKETPTAYLQRDGSSCARRVVLVMGFAVIRLHKMRAHAIDAPSAGCTELAAAALNQNVELSAQGRSSGNPFFSILYILGILGSGFLVALFVSKMKEKATSDATIEYMKNALEEKEAAVTLLEKKIEEELTNLFQELQNEQKVVEELTIQVDNLEHSLQDAGEEKWRLQQELKEMLNCVEVFQERIDLLFMEIMHKEGSILQLTSKLSKKDRELKQLNSVCQQSEDHLTCLQIENRQLKVVVLNNQEMLELKNACMNKLDAELTTLQAEKDESEKKLDVTSMEYNNYKSAMEKKSTSDAKLLREREGKIHLLEEQLKTAFDDKENANVLISALTQERYKLEELLYVDFKNMKVLGEKLRSTQATLEKSKCETSYLSEQLLEARKLCQELEDKVSKVQAEFNEARESLQKKLDEAKQGAEILAEEVTSTTNLLSKSNQELQIMSTDLAAALQKCNILEEDLIKALRNAESATVDLNEAKKTISSLNKELKDRETQISEDKEARKSLESKLEEANNFLNERNKNASTLSTELKLAHSKISSLEKEKGGLYILIDEQKQASQESRITMEGANSLVIRLGKERESLVERGKKLEEELASAKGEILTLMSRINSSKTEVDVSEGEKPAASSRRSVHRRRKAKSQKQDP